MSAARMRSHLRSADEESLVAVMAGKAVDIMALRTLQTLSKSGELSFRAAAALSSSSLDRSVTPRLGHSLGEALKLMAMTALQPDPLNICWDREQHMQLFLQEERIRRDGAVEVQRLQQQVRERWEEARVKRLRMEATILLRLQQDRESSEDSLCNCSDCIAEEE